MSHAVLRLSTRFRRARYRSSRMGATSWVSVWSCVWRETTPRSLTTLALPQQRCSLCACDTGFTMGSGALSHTVTGKPSTCSPTLEAGVTYRAGDCAGPITLSEGRIPSGHRALWVRLPLPMRANSHRLNYPSHLSHTWALPAPPLPRAPGSLTLARQGYGLYCRHAIGHAPCLRHDTTRTCEARVRKSSN
jgi:hypothetical protein